MKTTRFLNMILVSLVGAAFAACSSEGDALQGSRSEEPAAEAQTYTMTVEAQKGGANTRTLAFDGDDIKATWTVGEEVKVYNASDVLIGTLKAQTGGTATTTLKGALLQVPTTGESLRLEFLSPDYNSQDGTLTGTDRSIDKVCDYATATVSVSAISGTDVSTTGAAFAKQQAIIEFTLKDGAGNDLTGNPTAFTVTDGTSTVTLSDIPTATYTANGGNVLYVAFPASGSNADITLTATVGGETYRCGKAGITLSTSQYYGVTVQMNADTP